MFDHHLKFQRKLLLLRSKITCSIHLTHLLSASQNGFVPNTYSMNLWIKYRSMWFLKKNESQTTTFIYPNQHTTGINISFANWFEYNFRIVPGYRNLEPTVVPTSFLDGFLKKYLFIQQNWIYSYFNQSFWTEKHTKG